MNGSMLFENLRGQATPEWLGGLCEEDEQPEWRAQVFQETGWQAPKTAHIVNEVLNAEFTENPKTLPTGKVVKLVRPWPNEPEYRLEGSPETVASFGQALSNRIILSLQKSGIQAHCDTEDKKNGSRELQTRCYSFMPARRDKASPVRFLINALPGIQKLVTAGNAENDLPMLLPTHIENKPNHPLLCGLNPSMLAQVTLKGHGTSVDQQSNDLAQEIWQTIKPSTKTSAKSDRVRGCLRSTTN
ncbi:hypothetical protein [Vampirovibrio sp.]|uniref:hypothetical protein n=1 Tax=Vampirovibrio sp. TaxID=2717857 RepID=UPI003593926B